MILLHSEEEGVERKGNLLRCARNKGRGGCQNICDNNLITAYSDEYFMSHIEDAQNSCK